MRKTVLLGAIVVSACSPADQAGHDVLVTGTIIGKPFPRDASAIAHFIALDKPVYVEGKEYREVKIDEYNDAVLFFRRPPAFSSGTVWSPGLL